LGMTAPITSIDLFCGGGGFSLGLEQAGIRTVAAVDFDPRAMDVFRANFPHVTHAYCADLTALPPSELAQRIGADRVDVVVGGPPCQGFSQVRQRDGANHGPRLIDDPRRHLYREFLKYVGHFRPSYFVMENVLGIRSAEGGRYYTAVHAAARALGYRVFGQVVKAAEFGVPQKRQRQLIIGTRHDVPRLLHRGMLLPSHPPSAQVTLWEAIGDLPLLRAGEGVDPASYDLRRREEHLRRVDGRYLRNVLEIAKSQELTAHCARPHSDRDLRDFARIREGEHARQAIERGEELEFPYDRSSFHDRYTRQHRHKLCSTIVAHLSRDGLMFIHPTQNRSLTPREAARIQSFPDWYQFPVARTHQFRIIGNAVPPLVAKAVGTTIRNLLSGGAVKLNRRTGMPLYIPKSIDDALPRVRRLAESSGPQLRRMTIDEFKSCWPSVAYMFPGLHPDAGADHGSEVDDGAEVVGTLTEELRKIAFPAYVESGWPVPLAPVLREAWRRYEAGELADEEFYCVDAARAALALDAA
jgi:DNA (cytosine-5)-methyltransferase 1